MKRVSSICLFDKKKLCWVANITLPDMTILMYMAEKHSKILAEQVQLVVRKSQCINLQHGSTCKSCPKLITAPKSYSTKRTIPRRHNKFLKIFPMDWSKTKITLKKIFFESNKIQALGYLLFHHSYNPEVILLAS